MMAPLKLRVREVTFHVLDCRTRLPFRFGVHTLTYAPLCLARVLMESSGGALSEGFSSDLLVPRWFEKTPGQSVDEDWRRLMESAKLAGEAALDGEVRDTVFAHWLRIHGTRVATAPGPERLMRGEGVALVERAMIDAACRYAESTFFDALKSGLLGFRPGQVDPALSNWDLGSALPARPLANVHIRHTVGLVDALRRSDVSARVNDGLPESLEEDIDEDRLTHFKLKMSGDAERDLERLVRIMEVIGERVATPRVTLDGNEQFESMEDIATVLERLSEHELGQRLLANLLVIEQPLSRAKSFDEEANAGIERVSRFAPCIIDEADAEVDALPRAAALGYGGVSVKNCKGVFRALINFGRCVLSEGRLVQTAEDLTNLPVVALQQDLATISAIGLTHAERNGHHYFRGLGHLPRGTQEGALGNHPDLYVDSGTGPRVRIEEGSVSTASLHGAIGYAFDVGHDLREWTPMERWSPEDR